MTLEHVILCGWLLLIAAIIGAFAGREIARRVAVWVGNKIADMWGGSPRL